MKPIGLPETDARNLSKIITATAEILSGLAVIEIAAGIRQDAGIQKIAGEGLRAAHKIEVQLDEMLRAGGWEIRHTSPMVRSLVRVGTGLHESLESTPAIGNHVGAVGEGSMPETTVQTSYPKPVTGKNKPVTGRLGRSK